MPMLKNVVAALSLAAIVACPALPIQAAISRWVQVLDLPSLVKEPQEPQEPQVKEWFPAVRIALQPMRAAS